MLHNLLLLYNPIRLLRVPDVCWVDTFSVALLRYDFPIDFHCRCLCTCYRACFSISALYRSASLPLVRLVRCSIDMCGGSNRSKSINTRACRFLFHPPTRRSLSPVPTRPVMTRTRCPQTAFAVPEPGVSLGRRD